MSIWNASVFIAQTKQAYNLFSVREDSNISECFLFDKNELVVM
jgi:hypothetical protein